MVALGLAVVALVSALVSLAFGIRTHVIQNKIERKLRDG